MLCACMRTPCARARTFCAAVRMTCAGVRTAFASVNITLRPLNLLRHTNSGEAGGQVHVRTCEQPRLGLERGGERAVEPLGAGRLYVGARVGEAEPLEH